MKSTRKLLIALWCLVLLCTGCQNRRQNRRSGQVPQAAPLRFEPPQTPMYLSSQEEAAAFLALHYWDTFPFADTLCIRQENFAKQAFLGYTQLLRYVPLSTACQGITLLMQKAGADSTAAPLVLPYFAELCANVFNDPNSPLRQEDLFIASLHAQLENPYTSAHNREQATFLLHLAQRNRVGTTAIDLEYVSAQRNFSYTANPAQVHTLHSLKAPYLLLFFNNPGCPNCREVMEDLLASPLLTRYTQKGTLVVLTLYPDQDLEAWEEYLPQLPAQWINAYNPNTWVKDHHLYDLKAIPTLYLLDAQKTVLVKDGTTAEEIEAALPLP